MHTRASGTRITDYPLDLYTLLIRAWPRYLRKKTKVSFRANTLKRINPDSQGVQFMGKVYLKLAAVAANAETFFTRVTALRANRYTELSIEKRAAGLSNTRTRRIPRVRAL